MVKPKKHLGQHFLTDLNIAKSIVEALSCEGYSNVLEVGPGMGVLTQFLIQHKEYTSSVVDLDQESIEYLKATYPSLGDRIIYGDFLKAPLDQWFSSSFAVIGNFPYNISSQILFKVLDYRNQVPEVVGMFQKEVAERVAEGPGTKAYGVISVLLQAYYDIEYLFTVHENVFNPPPKVKSGVIRLKRNSVQHLDCDEKLFKQVVKMGFNQRRKTLRNSLKALLHDGVDKHLPVFSQRPEQLGVEEFVKLTQLISPE